MKIRIFFHFFQNGIRLIVNINETVVPMRLAPAQGANTRNSNTDANMGESIGLGKSKNWQHRVGRGTQPSCQWRQDNYQNATKRDQLMEEIIWEEERDSFTYGYMNQSVTRSPRKARGLSLLSRPQGVPTASGVRLECSSRDLKLAADFPCCSS